MNIYNSEFVNTHRILCLKEYILLHINYPKQLIKNLNCKQTVNENDTERGICGEMLKVTEQEQRRAAIQCY